MNNKSTSIEQTGFQNELLNVEQRETQGFNQYNKAFTFLKSSNNS